MTDTESEAGQTYAPPYGRAELDFAMAQSTTYHLDVHQPRNPKASAYYKCVENYFGELEQAWDDMYKSRYGYWRTYVMTVIYKYLDCGDLHL